MTPNEKLKLILHEHPNSPFLFVGSGFSQRYLGVPTWEALLRRFCSGLAPFEYYLASSDSKLPRCASLIAKDYAEHWWKSDALAAQREKYKAHIVASSSPLKVAISDLLLSECKLIKDARLVDELNGIRALNAEGIITTNWDGLLESLFPDYKVYVGQQSIVRQTPQNVGEIFKIHGCCSNPNSLVLTEEDYTVFREKQAYLAAKLITIFVEHPVIFIGYSVSDPNVLELLRAILRGLGTDEVKSLQKNLIFLQRARDGRPIGVTETILVVDGSQLPVTSLVTDDFVGIYSALAQSKLKLPARVLRFCKEQLYELVSSKEPSEKLCLTNINDIKERGDIEFVVGFGVVNAHMSERGYLGVTAKDLFKYVICDSPQLEGRAVLEQSMPTLDVRNNYLPVHRFLQEAEVGELTAEMNSTVRRLAAAGRDSFKTNGYAKSAVRETEGRDFQWIVETLPPEKAAAYIPHLSDDRIPLPALKAFAVTHFEKAFEDRYSTFYRKLFCLYDFLKFGGKEFKR